MKNIAHTKNVAGERQGLEEHLHNVAETAARFSAAFGGETFARYAGLLHDIGKYAPEFQQYLLQAENNPRQGMKGPDHKSAGAVFAASIERTGALSGILFGHHGGVPDYARLQTTIRERRAKKSVQDAITTAKEVFPELRVAPEKICPSYVHSALEREFFTRMAFSALVDADFLDTEQHFNAGKRPERTHTWSITDLWHAFETSYKNKFANAEQSSLNSIRAEVYQHCMKAAHLPPGFFRLTVPTGGGKTLASLAFALQHAQIHGLERIIYAIPYTSIIDQTANVFRKMFGDEQALIEHHSNISVPDPEQPTPIEIRRRLIAENWDAPLIATTTVQLFESLLGHSTSKCRKLHNIAKSIIVLDEVQMLPVYFLTPILDVLRQLCAYYGVTVLLCTATQPDFESRQSFEGLPHIQEIIPRPENYFANLKRVEYQLPKAGETWTWEQVAERVRAEQHILVIVNTRRDAIELLTLLTSTDNTEEEEDALFHLSTRLCGEHRKAVLEEVRRRLLTKEPCRLIATQVIEAGVDVDFPLVMRAIGPLDSIVQAAGRANREGTMPSLGKVIVFVPEEGHTPKGSYLVGTDIAKRLLADDEANLHDPTLYQRYFQEYYSLPYRDHHGIQELRKHFNYAEVAQTFHMIDDTSTAVIVTYEPASDKIENLFDRLRKARSVQRDDLRALQPYIVNLSKYEFDKAKEHCLVTEIVPGVWRWNEQKYDSGKDGKHGQGILLDGMLSADNFLW